MPSLALGMPVYNGARLVGDAIDCILRQSYGDFTLTILDNASTDETEEICRDYAAGDSRVRYLRKDVNVGARRNFNDAFHATDGDYFKWCAHDDLHEPGYLEACLAVLETDRDVVLCHSRTDLIDIAGKPLLANPAAEVFTDWTGLLRTAQPPRGRATHTDPFRRFESIVCHTSRGFDIFGIIRRDVLAKTGLIRAYYGADLTLLAELSLYGRFHEVPEVLFHKREHAGQSRSLKTAGERARWMDPRIRRWQSLSFGRNTRALGGAVLRSPIPAARKARCLAMLAANLNWLAPLRVVGVDVKTIRHQQKARRLSRDPGGGGATGADGRL